MTYWKAKESQLWFLEIDRFFFFFSNGMQSLYVTNFSAASCNFSPLSPTEVRVFSRKRLFCWTHYRAHSKRYRLGKMSSSVHATAVQLIVQEKHWLFFQVDSFWMKSPSTLRRDLSRWWICICCRRRFPATRQSPRTRAFSTFSFGCAGNWEWWLWRMNDCPRWREFFFSYGLTELDWTWLSQGAFISLFVSLTGWLIDWLIELNYVNFILARQAVVFDWCFFCRSMMQIVIGSSLVLKRSMSETGAAAAVAGGWESDVYHRFYYRILPLLFQSARVDGRLCSIWKSRPNEGLQSDVCAKLCGFRFQYITVYGSQSNN